MKSVSFVCLDPIAMYTGTLNICIVWTLLKTFHSGDMPLFACHNDQQLGSFSTKNTLMVLDTITKGIVCELLARSVDYLN